MERFGELNGAFRQIYQFRLEAAKATVFLSAAFDPTFLLRFSYDG